MTFNLFKILKGMLTPYFRSDNVRGPDKVVDVKCPDCYQIIPAGVSCKVCHDKFFAEMRGRLTNSSISKCIDRSSQGAAVSARFFDGTSPGDQPAPLSDGTSPGGIELHPSPNRNARKKRPTSRNTRRMNGRGFSNSPAVFDNDDSGPSCSSSSSSSSDSSGGCGGGD